MFEYRLTPRFVDADGLGHISNTALPVWLEEARTPLFRAFNPSLDLKTWNLILKTYTIDIHRQIEPLIPVRIDGAIEHIGNTSLVVVQRVYQTDGLVADGRTVLVHFDYETQQPTRIPAIARQWLAQHHPAPKSWTEA